MIILEKDSNVQELVERFLSIIEKDYDKFMSDNKNNINYKSFLLIDMENDELVLNNLVEMDDVIKRSFVLKYDEFRKKDSLIKAVDDLMYNLTKCILNFSYTNTNFDIKDYVSLSSIPLNKMGYEYKDILEMIIISSFNTFSNELLSKPSLNSIDKKQVSSFNNVMVNNTRIYYHLPYLISDLDPELIKDNDLFKLVLFSFVFALNDPIVTKYMIDNKLLYLFSDMSYDLSLTSKYILPFINKDTLSIFKKFYYDIVSFEENSSIKTDSHIDYENKFKEITGKDLNRESLIEELGW